MNDIMKGKYPMDEDQFLYTSASVIIIMLTNFIDMVLKTMCKYMNIKPEWAGKLNMKNEFFFRRMLFTSVKKRYAALMILKEGQLVTDDTGDLGDLEIKGFDFIKSGTKPSLKKFYSDLCLNDILREKNINPVKIKAKLDELRENILISVNSGDREFYKNANVSMIETYKFPYRIPGIKGTVLWNILFPDEMIELPTSVDLISIKSFKNKKYRAEFAEKFPEEYKKLEDAIFNNPNEHIAGMDLNVIAIPKGVDKLPECVHYLIDIEKILQDSLNLILPVTSSLGIKAVKCGTNVKQISNIISL
jgi:hypothetical protein